MPHSSPVRHSLPTVLFVASVQRLAQITGPGFRQGRQIAHQHMRPRYEISKVGFCVRLVQTRLSGCGALGMFARLREQRRAVRTPTDPRFDSRHLSREVWDGPDPTWAGLQALGTRGRGSRCRLPHGARPSALTTRVTRTRKETTANTHQKCNCLPLEMPGYHQPQGLGKVG